MFYTPRKTPEPIIREIKKSFELYWINQDACLNSIRRSLEILCDEFKIPRYRNPEEKSGFISLARRIEQLHENANLNIEKEILDTIKDSGNFGTHNNKDIIDDEVIKITYELLQHIISKIYDKERYNKLVKSLKGKLK